MKIIAEYGNELAKVFVAQMRGDDPRSVIEFVESVQPPLPREKKWVLIISSMFGCPIGCRMCDAGGDFAGLLNTDEMLAQIDAPIVRRYPDRKIPSSKFKIQFARMGEPSLNPSVLEVMRLLPSIYHAPGLMISISTVAPARAVNFFDELVTIKERLYGAGKFQLQFSIHTTDQDKRSELIPTRTWTFEQMAIYGDRFCCPEKGDRKVTLNFAPMIGYPIDASAIREHFDPKKFLIKLTPMNPTLRSMDGGISSAITSDSTRTSEVLIDDFTRNGYDVILSIGEVEENRIGSNCGQFIQRTLREGRRPQDAYDLDHYQLRE